MLESTILCWGTEIKRSYKGRRYLFKRTEPSRLSYFSPCHQETIGVIHYTHISRKTKYFRKVYIKKETAFFVLICCLFLLLMDQILLKLRMSVPIIVYKSFSFRISSFLPYLSNRSLLFSFHLKIFLFLFRSFLTHLFRMS